MEVIHLSLDDPAAFDGAVHGHKCGKRTLPQASEISIITKHKGTDAGAAIAVITFEVELGGILAHVQATTTVKLLRGAAQILMANYDADGKPRS
jgi:hypothetical protein